MVYGARDLQSRRQVYRLLAQAAEEHWALSPLPSIQRHAEGKPYFPQGEGREFNLSHSGSLGLCALDEQPVGVDIQIVKERRAGLPGRVCAREELDWLEEQPDRWKGFAVLWALKESRVKQSGRGLRDDIPGIQVPIPQEGHTLYRLNGLYYRLYSGPDWAGAACGLSVPPAEIRWRRTLTG